MSTGKLKFEDLEYIVMEGGGARGAAYLGAIRALERKMQERMQAPNSNIRLDCLPDKEVPALLDYVWDTGDRAGLPVIKGIAGSSAGAITTFALALGFNSVEIKGILDYPFEKFLSDVDVGRYRMIDQNGDLAIGQDKKQDKRGNKELAFEKKFEFKFTDDATPIGDNNVKRGKRDLFFGTIFKIVVDGTLSNVQQITNFAGRFFGVNSPDDVPSFWRGFFRWIFRPNNNLIARIGLGRVLRLLFFKVAIRKFLKVPIKFDTDNVMAAISDSGMFSGFKVREFFMDLVILAATKDTQFHRGLRLMIQDKSLKDIKKIFGQDVDKNLKNIQTDGISTLLQGFGDTFELGSRSASKIGSELRLALTLRCMSLLTCDQFNKITGINFAVCVSNFTTGSPVYFGHEWTPDFRVMEAVAASMSIPPAIKPLYNVDDVVKDKEGKFGLPSFVDDGKFELADYYFYEHAVKLAIQEEIKNDPNTKDSFVHANNAIDVSTFLPKLRGIVIGEYDRSSGEVKLLNPNSAIERIVDIAGQKVKVDYTMFRFFYNAIYKGLFLDGGYRNNIPYNLFRLRNENINSVFAIKLDGHFPPDLMKAVMDKIRAKLNNIDIIELVEDFEQSEMDIVDIESGGIRKELDIVRTKEYKITRADIITETALVFKGYIRNLDITAETEAERRKLKEIYQELDRQDKRPIKKLAKSTLKNYRKKHLSPPWTHRVSLLNTALEGYDYGSERGQVKQISDHNQILPLYDYGLGTYDFDMSKVQPMIKLAQLKSEQETTKFFQ